MQLNYHTIYEVASSANSPWRIGIAFAVCAVALIWFRRSLKSQGAVRHWIMRAAVLIVAGAGVFFATYEPAARGQLKQAMDKGTYQTVEGVISDYTVADPAKKIPEHFTVQSADASHNTFIMRPTSPGYHETRASGSPLKAGECVRVAMIQGAIGRLEVADACQR